MVKIERETFILTSKSYVGTENNKVPNNSPYHKTLVTYEA